MSTKANESSSLSALWNWVKRLFGSRDSSKNHQRCETKLRREAQFLEYCYSKDCEIEANRKRLERYWKDISV